MEPKSAGTVCESSSAAEARARGISSTSEGTGNESCSLGAAGAMDVAPFVDGQYVRLLNRGRGGYLFADETGRGVSLDHGREMVNTAWVVQILETDTAVRLMLRGAYGRHLAVTPYEAPAGHIGLIATQCIYDDAEDFHIRWWTTPGKKGSVVLLNGTGANLKALRANGRYRWWNRCVTVEAIHHSRVTSMMEWVVEVIPLRVDKPPYQVRPAGVELPWRPGVQEVLDVSYIVTDDKGDIYGQGWTQVTFYGRSVIELGNNLARRMRVNLQDITLFIRGGELAEPTLLLTDLPFRDDPVEIVVYRVGSTAHNQLRFPDLAVE